MRRWLMLAAAALCPACAAGPAWEAGEEPTLAPAQARVIEEEVLPADGEPSGGSGTSAEPITDGTGDALDEPSDPITDVCTEDSGDTCQAFDLKAACQYACAAATAEACTVMAFACIGADVVTIGSLTIPCGIVVVGACVGGAACLVACA